MRKYVVRWTENNHYESVVWAEDKDVALNLAMQNLGEYQDHWCDVEENSVEVAECPTIDIS